MYACRIFVLAWGSMYRDSVTERHGMYITKFICEIMYQYVHDVPVLIPKNTTTNLKCDLKLYNCTANPHIWQVTSTL